MRQLMNRFCKDFGRDALENLKPYVLKFIRDVRNGDIVVESENPTQDVEESQGNEPRPDSEPDQGLLEDEVQDQSASVDTQGFGTAGTGSGRPDLDGGENAPDGGAGPEDSNLGGDEGGGVPNTPTHGGLEKPAALSGPNPGNFQITPDLKLGSGGVVTKLKDNLAALRLLKKLDSEARYATAGEQAVLARYVGWGGLKRVFSGVSEGASDHWDRTRAELKALLSPGEFEDASMSTMNAHYTSETVVSEMWKAITDLGFAEGRALEPSMGSGNFLGLQDPAQRSRTEWHGVELDQVTGRIATHLYPDALIEDGVGLEAVDYKNGAFDLVIGNPPFGSIRVKDYTNPSNSAENTTSCHMRSRQIRFWRRS